MSDDLIKVAICDDTDEDRLKLISLLQKYADTNNLLISIDSYRSGEEFLKSNTSQYLLVFLDIFMGEINGMDTAKALISQNKNVQVVFISTSIDFAAEAFGIEALNYIVKPATEKRVNQVLEKFFEQYYFVKTISVKKGRIQEDIYVSDIVWAEAKGKNSILHLKSGDTECSSSLAELANSLPSSDFCKPIRWAIVSMREVTAIPTDKLILSDKTEIPISRNQRETIKNAFAAFKWKRMRDRLGGR